MPCDECGNLLCVSNDGKRLFCPSCADIRVESDAVLQATMNWYLKDYFTEERILTAAENYRKPGLVLYLISRLNHITNIFFEEQQTGIPVSEFGYLCYILKQVYQKPGSEFGDEQLSGDFQELDEEIEILQSAYTQLIRTYRDVQNGFQICVRTPEYNARMEDFSSNYSRFQSELGLCFERCMNSILCGDYEDYEDYSFVADTLRMVDKTDVDKVEDSRDFADAWYQYILQLRLMASSDDMVGNAYYTRLPEAVTIFHIEEFLDRLDSHLTDEQHQRLQEGSFACLMRPQEVEQSGRAAFGDLWDDVWDSLIVSEENFNAHPFLFALDVSEEHETSGALPTQELKTTRVIYPRFFARVLKFQIFPLLKNGDEPRSHTILADLTAARGQSYERNIYDYLTQSGLECYHGAEITKANPNEIDLIVELPEKVLFIEVKYLMPPTNISEREGVMELNEDFDRLIFNEVSTNSDRKPSGKPFPEKVEAWIELDTGDRFTSQVGSEDGDRKEHRLDKDWGNLETEMIVLSNIVPSYPTKRGVRFLTDLEFYQWMEHGDESAFF